jgi:hypothetical protein
MPNDSIRNGDHEKSQVAPSELLNYLKLFHFLEKSQKENEKLYGPKRSRSKIAHLI